MPVKRRELVRGLVERDCYGSAGSESRSLHRFDQGGRVAPAPRHAEIKKIRWRARLVNSSAWNNAQLQAPSFWIPIQV
jgi:hypothetical protein